MFKVVFIKLKKITIYSLTYNIIKSYENFL
nr:MAG TPA: hypothetical protein [Caudoviricetes sp.]